MFMIERVRSSRCRRNDLGSAGSSRRTDQTAAVSIPRGLPQSIRPGWLVTQSTPRHALYEFASPDRAHRTGAFSPRRGHPCRCRTRSCKRAAMIRSCRARSWRWNHRLFHVARPMDRRTWSPPSPICTTQGIEHPSPPSTRERPATPVCGVPGNEMVGAAVSVCASMPAPGSRGHVRAVDADGRRPARRTSARHPDRLRAGIRRAGGGRAPPLAARPVDGRCAAARHAVRRRRRCRVAGRLPPGHRRGRRWATSRARICSSNPEAALASPISAT